VLVENEVDEQLARHTLATNPEPWIGVEAARMLVRSGAAKEVEGYVRSIAEGDWFADELRSAAIDDARSNRLGMLAALRRGNRSGYWAGDVAPERGDGTSRLRAA
jgi:hypothetical protein